MKEISFQIHKSLVAILQDEEGKRALRIEGTRFGEHLAKTLSENPMFDGTHYLIDYTQEIDSHLLHLIDALIFVRYSSSPMEILLVKRKGK